VIEAKDLLEVIDDRSPVRSTLVVSQLPVEAWIWFGRLFRAPDLPSSRRSPSRGTHAALMGQAISVRQSAGLSVSSGLVRYHSRMRSHGTSTTAVFSNFDNT